MRISVHPLFFLSENVFINRIPLWFVLQQSPRNSSLYKNLHEKSL